ncbi:MAG: putative toxin-antitoxin system toxin component, PIN family [Beijerinckiaceae bacterium]
MRVVVDTNIIVSALMSPSTAPRQVLRLCLTKKLKPLIGSALFAEYNDVMARDVLFAKCPVQREERDALLDALFSVTEWVKVHFLWRPNLRDEADNHLIELAVAGGAEIIISANKRDLDFGELLFPDLRIMTAGEFLNERS